MSAIMIRSIILYMLIIFAVRLMGKRQLGELQPSELVITILVSNIATLPLEDTDIPLLLGITPILALVCCEVLVSCIILKLPFLRRLTSGSPKIIISNGVIDRKALRELRFSVDDLMTALRGQQVFDLAEVQFAIVETTGSISVMKKQSEDTPTRRDLGISPENADPPQVIVSDGRILSETLENMGLDKKIIPDSTEDIFIMTADEQGNTFTAGKGAAK